MSEIQNIITGFFAVFGVVIGALLEFLRERWHYAQKKETRQKETEENNKKSYLSPLCFYVNKSLFLVPFENRTKTFKGLRQELLKFEDISGIIKAIEDLMKNNMHVLPMELNMSLELYVTDLEAFTNFTRKMSGLIGNVEITLNETEVPEDLLEGFLKLGDAFSDMRNKLSITIYAFMKFNIIPKEEPIAHKEKTKEIIEILDAISVSLDSVIGKIAIQETENQVNP